MVGWYLTGVSCGLQEPSNQHLSDKIWFSVKGKSDRYVSTFLKVMKEITKLEAQYFLKQFKEQLHQGHLGLFFLIYLTNQDLEPNTRFTEQLP